MISIYCSGCSRPIDPSRGHFFDDIARKEICWSCAQRRIEEKLGFKDVAARRRGILAA